jgi:hypothetical protein
MVAWHRDFGAVFGAMQDHGAIPYGAMQCNHDAIPHGAMQKWSYCEIFTDSVYFVLKFWRRVNYGHCLLCMHLHALAFGGPTIRRPILNNLESVGYYISF